MLKCYLGLVGNLRFGSSSVNQYNIVYLMVLLRRLNEKQTNKKLNAWYTRWYSTVVNLLHPITYHLFLSPIYRFMTFTFYLFMYSFLWLPYHLTSNTTHVIGFILLQPGQVGACRGSWGKKFSIQPGCHYQRRV